MWFTGRASVLCIEDVPLFLCIQDEYLGNWCIRRSVDGRELPPCTLPRDLTIKAGAQIKVRRSDETNLANEKFKDLY